MLLVTASGDRRVLFSQLDLLNAGIRRALRKMMGSDMIPIASANNVKYYMYSTGSSSGRFHNLIALPYYT